MKVNLPNIAISSALDAVLEEVGGQSLALLLVVLSNRSKLVRVALRSNLELGPALLLGGLRRHGSVEVAVTRLTRGASSARALVARRGLTCTVSCSTTTTKVLVGELVNESVCRVVGSRGLALLVRSLGSLRIASRGLVGVGGRIWVVHEVSLATVIASSILLLLLGRLRVCLLRAALALRLEDRVGEGRGGGRIGTAIRDELVVVVAEVEVQAVGIVIIHDGRLCRCVRRTEVVGRDVVVL